jgi:uncharacterized protein (TIGR00369 family)
MEKYVNQLTDAQRAQLTAQFEGSPFSRTLGVEAVDFDRDRAILRLPFRQENTTVADVVHGGAILTLADIAATAAAWSGIDDPTAYRGLTANLSLSFIAAGRGQTLLADARVIRRGSTLTFLEVAVTDEQQETVARAMVTYKLSRALVKS